MARFPATRLWLHIQSIISGSQHRRSSLKTATTPDSYSTGSFQPDWDSKDEFFRFTRGRFVVDETENLRKREIRFDMNQLADVANSVGATRCISIKKYPDGMFNKTFLMVMDDGREVVAKVPNPNAGIPHFTTASEVATMVFNFGHTGTLCVLMELSRQIEPGWSRIHYHGKGRRIPSIADDYILNSDGNINAVVFLDIEHRGKEASFSIWRLCFEVVEGGETELSAACTFKQVFRTTDGLPAESMSLTFDPKDFAPECEVKAYSGLDQKINISARDLCDYLDSAEQIQRRQERHEGSVNSLPKGTRKRRQADIGAIRV